MCTLGGLCLTLDSNCPVPWNSTAESQLHAEYPLYVVLQPTRSLRLLHYSLDQEETVDTFVIRRYLETLWLPEVRLALIRAHPY